MTDGNYELLEKPDTYKKIGKRLKRQTENLYRLRNRLVRALGIPEGGFVNTELDQVVDELDDIEFHLESRSEQE